MNDFLNHSAHGSEVSSAWCYRAVKVCTTTSERELKGFITAFSSITDVDSEVVYTKTGYCIYLKKPSCFPRVIFDSLKFRASNLS